MTILESIQTLKDCPMIEHVKRKLLFIGGIKAMIVVDLPSKTIIARFNFFVVVKSIRLSQIDEGSGIHVLSKELNLDTNKYTNYFHRITFEQNAFTKIKNGRLTKVSAICSNP